MSFETLSLWVMYIPLLKGESRSTELLSTLTAILMNQH